MFRRETPLLVAAFVAGVFLVGLPRRPVPVDHSGGFDPLTPTCLAGLAVLAMMLIVGQVAKPRRAWLVMASCLPIAMLGQAAIGDVGGAAGHRLGPAELALAFGVAIATVLPGVLAGALAHRLQSRGRG